MENNITIEKKALIAFIPVLHEGYRRLLAKHPDAHVYVLGPDIVAGFKPLTKDIRALDQELIIRALKAWNITQGCSILHKEDLASFQADVIIMPDEDVARELTATYFSNKEVVFERIFLRWDKHSTLAERPVDNSRSITTAALDQEFMGIALEESTRASDFWRHVGTVLVASDGTKIIGHNRHVPSEHMPYLNSDPRNNFSKGLYLELSTSIHAEAGAIAEAAKRGVILEGASIYVTTFPCPPCAKMIAYSGIKKIYYHSGYGVLDGEDVLKSQGVEIIFVDMEK